MSIRHDYKSATTGQRRQHARRYGLLVMTLVLIGLFGGLLAYIKGGQTQPAPTTAAVAPSTPAQPPTTPAQPPAASPLLKPVALSVAEPEPVKPKYDFYTELPKRKIAIQRETVKPGNVSRPAPARIQPAANQLQKPAAPRRNATSPTMATASGAKPDSKTANSKTANSKTANNESANPKTTNSKTANSKTANSKTANSTSTSTSTNSRPATAKPTPAAPPARTAQPLRPFTNNNAKIIVKTEQAP